MITPSLFWETLLVTLRGIIIRYSRQRKRAKNEDKKRTEDKILELNEKINCGEGTRQEHTELAELNDKLLKIRKEELNGSMIRSRADWLEYGEKPNRFFLNLENNNRINNIAELEINETTTITDQNEIMTALIDFYSNLCKATTPNIDTPTYEANIKLTTLTLEEQKSLEHPITKEELGIVLHKLKNNKSPGLDGYSPEFYKRFWPQLGHFFLDCINESFSNGYLTNSQTQGLITCLPKTGKARNLIKKNWRPISLLNTTYKLISLCITNRIRPLLPKLISPEQKGFMSGRSISDCTRLMFGLVYECQQQNIEGLILLVDFEKAFDSLSWDFILKTLKNFNFGPNLIKWISLFQQNSNSRITLNV